MNLPENLPLLPLHAANQKKFQMCVDNQCIPQALLFTGPLSCQISMFINHILAAVLCIEKNKPCGNCSACRMILEVQHPDVQWIRAEKKGGLIKIDQIRTIQTDIYQYPALGDVKFIVIDGAEYMNIASANALLKILEEPPGHAHFLLITEQIATVPATIISRCQIWRFHHEEKYYLPAMDAPDAAIYADILQQLLLVSQKELHYSVLAEQWKTRDLRELLECLYRISAQIILMQTQQNQPVIAPAFKTLSAFLSTDRCFGHLDKINTIQKKIIHNVNMNSALVLEDLLMEY